MAHDSKRPAKVAPYANSEEGPGLCRGDSLYGEVQCAMVNGHMRPRGRQNDLAGIHIPQQKSLPTKTRFYSSQWPSKRVTHGIARPTHLILFNVKGFSEN